MSTSNDDFLDFLFHAISPFHMVSHIRTVLTSQGYTELSLLSPFPAPLPAKAFLVRDEISVLAFSIGTYDSAIILNADYDFPILRPRPNSAYEHNGHHYVVLEHNGSRRLDIRSYGDQILSMAGAVFVRRDGRLVRCLVSQDSVAVLPTFPPPGRGRSENNSFAAIVGGRSLRAVVAELCACTEDEIVDWDLQFSAAERPRIIGNEVHGTWAVELGACYSILTAFLKKSETSNGVKFMAIYAGGIGRRFLRAGPGSNFFNNVARAVFRDRDYGAVQVNSLNVVVEALVLDKLDKNCRVNTGIAIRVGVRSDSTTELIGAAIVEGIAQHTKVKLPIAVYSNMVVGPEGIAPKLLEVTDIRTVQLAQVVRALGTIRPAVKGSTLNSLIVLLTALYDEYDKVKPIFP
jgi:aspartyl aminopeptidase